MHLRRVDADQPNLPDARQPQRVAVGVLRYASGGEIAEAGRIRGRIGAAGQRGGREECGGREEGS